MKRFIFITLLFTQFFIQANGQLNLKPRVSRLSISADTSWLFIVAGEGYLFNLKSGKFIQVRYDGLLSRDGLYVLGNKISMYDANCNVVSSYECNGGEKFKGEMEPRLTVDGKYYIKRYEKGANIYDISNGQLLKTVKYPAKKCPYVYMNEKVGLFKNEDNTSLICYNLETGKTIYELKTIPSFTSHYANYAITSDNKRFIITNKKTFEVFDFETGKLIASIDASPQFAQGEYDIEDITLSIDNKTLGCIYRNKFHIYNLETGVFVSTIDADNNYSVPVFIPGNQTMILGDGERLKWIWNEGGHLLKDIK